ncbi:hypothetical protein VLK31_21555 [Variovorax sp. H27-G14]|uniref:hypothetical protein n=1 Tax=Variovorax sp. H27-G14 TaxID=3111914 RepID=UPI0038FC548E
MGHARWRTGIYVGQLDGDMSVTGFARGIVNYAAGSNDLRSQYLGAYASWKRRSGGIGSNVSRRLDHDARHDRSRAACQAKSTMTYIRHLLVLSAAVACTHISAQTTRDVPRSSNDAPMPATSQGSISASNAAVFKACADAPAANGACPLDAVFGLFKLAPNNAVLGFKASNTVPRKIDQNYGWVLKLNQKTGKVRVLERMTLPQTPKTWGTAGQPYGTSPDRKTISLDVTLTVYDGTISKSWDVAKGDPAGHYLISAYVGDSAPVQFEFDVIDPK